MSRHYRLILTSSLLLATSALLLGLLWLTSRHVWGTDLIRQGQLQLYDRKTKTSYRFSDLTTQEAFIQLAKDQTDALRLTLLSQTRQDITQKTVGPLFHGGEHGSTASFPITKRQGLLGNQVTTTISYPVPAHQQGQIVLKTTYDKTDYLLEHYEESNWQALGQVTSLKEALTFYDIAYSPE